MGDIPTDKLIELSAGPLRMKFDQNTAFLRNICLKDREILRGIYVAVRDHNWLRPEMTLNALELESNPDSFHLICHLSVRTKEIDYAWQIRISGSNEGHIVYSVEGVSNSEFMRNRIGICVLHPIENTSGSECLVTYSTGEKQSGIFPEMISAHQLFFDIHTLRWGILPDLDAEVEFEGDIFEMEDQRNWTDASYKTYSTPLALPYPVPVKIGDTVSQSVTLSLIGSVPDPLAAPEIDDRISVLLGDKFLSDVPPIGLCISERVLDQQDIENLKIVGINHLRVDLHLSITGYLEDFI